MKNHLLTLFIIITTINFNAQTHDYAKAQALSVRFLGAQRCGDTQSWIHGACHTKDGEAVGKDLSGGWHDCGDHIKFHVTAPYTALIYLYAFDKFPETFLDTYSQAYSEPPANSIPDVLDEVKIQTDYLIKCVDGNTIYWEIGGEPDHNSFKEPVSNSIEELYENKTTSVRPVRSATEGHSNALGDSAAALALMAIKYATYDASYSQSCLTAAKKYYEVAKINEDATGDYDGSAYGFMEDSSKDDNMGVAAIMLYRATKESSYLTEAESYANVEFSEYWSPLFTYTNLDGMLYLELYHALGEVKYLNSMGARVATDISNISSCGYMHLYEWGSLRDAACSAFLATLYHNETNDVNAYNYAKRNIDFILGSHDDLPEDAPENFSFLIGYNELNGGYPQYPHHTSAFGKTTNDDSWSLFTQESDNPGSVPFAIELTGGLAGGPESECGNFHDNVGNAKSSEYCGYYNAGFTGALAYINKIENNIPVLSIGENSLLSNSFQIFPNPSEDIFHISNINQIKEVEVYNALGQQLQKKYPKSDEFKIDLKNYPKGVYFLKLNGKIGNTGTTHKIIKN